MQDPRMLLDEERLRRLRAAYDSKAMSAANVAAFAQVHPALHPWIEETAATFFERPSSLSPRDRERCIVALLAYTGPPLSLAVHIYWALMEGVSVDEVCHTIGLVACYGGLPKCAQGLLVAERLATLLRDVAELQHPDAAQVVAALIRELRGAGA
jgi:alkylhydroperoxidase/carboxymuconolactone decarboxylase family protein YurZ